MVEAQEPERSDKRLSILCLARLLSSTNTEGGDKVKRQERDVMKGFSLNAKASDSEEPGAVILQAGICAGRPGNWPFYGGALIKKHMDQDILHTLQTLRAMSLPLRQRS